MAEPTLVPKVTAEAIRRVHFLREAGVVERCHTTPHHNPYSVGLHSFNALNLILVLHPDPSIALVKGIMWHDAAERVTGDIPATTKWASPLLAKELEHLEKIIEARYEIDTELTPDELRWLKAVDRLELLLFAKEQIAEGNFRFGEYVVRLNEWFRNHWGQIPEPVSLFVTYHHLSRTTDVFDKP